MSEIQKFDPSLLMAGVRDRIKATFVSLIPDDQWERLCQKEMHEFFEPSKDRWGNREKMSSFSEVCNEVLRGMAKEKVIDFMNDFSQPMWDSVTNKAKPNELFKEFLLKHASEIFVATFGSMFAECVRNMPRQY